MDSKYEPYEEKLHYKNIEEFIDKERPLFPKNLPKTLLD